MISGGVKSSFLDITQGVPQGPVIFTIYLNNSLSVKTCNINLYADDTVM